MKNFLRPGQLWISKKVFAAGDKTGQHLVYNYGERMRMSYSLFNKDAVLLIVFVEPPRLPKTLGKKVDVDVLIEQRIVSLSFESEELWMDNFKELSLE